MKHLIFTLLLACGISLGLHAQTTVQLKHDSTNVWVGAYQHPINSLRARFLDTDSTLAIFGTDNTVFTAARKYNAYTDDAGSPFASYAALKAYIRQYFFVDASASVSGGGGLTKTQADTLYLPMTVNIVTADTITVMGSGTYTLTGTTARSWKMPSVSAATGMTIFIINRNTQNLTINSNSGGADLDINGVYSTNIVVAAGENYVLRGNSLKLVTVNN